MYKVRFSDSSLKTLSKLDKQIARMILAWIEKHLEGTEDPRLKGKGLSHDKKNVWRYRIGSYRLLANIKDEELLILVIDLGHRKDVYN